MFDRFSVDLGWIWDGSGVDPGCIWVDLGWIWSGSGVDLELIWSGSGVDLRCISVYIECIRMAWACPSMGVMCRPLGKNSFFRQNDVFRPFFP